MLTLCGTFQQNPDSNQQPERPLSFEVLCWRRASIYLFLLVGMTMLGGIQGADGCFWNDGCRNSSRTNEAFRGAEGRTTGSGMYLCNVLAYLAFFLCRVQRPSSSVNCMIYLLQKAWNGN